MIRILSSLFLPAGLDELEQFSFEFGVAVPVWAGLLLVAGVALGSGGYAYTRLRRASPGTRIALSGLRGVALALAVFLILDPTLIGYQVRPSDQTVAVIFDDSRSMGITHKDGKSRGELFRQAYGGDKGALDRALRERFQLAYYGLGDGVYRMSGPGALAYEAKESRIADGLKTSVDQIGRDRLAGIILLSDGVEQGRDGIGDDHWIESLGVPVFAAVLPSAPWSDLEVGEFRIPDTKFADTPVVLNVPLRADGLEGRTVVVDLMETVQEGEGAASRVVESKVIEITDAAEQRNVRFEFRPSIEGWVACAVRARLAESSPSQGDPSEGLPESTDDPILENNEFSFLLDLKPRTFRILYFSGRPNWENAFIRRAIADEPLLSMTTHIRVSEAEKRFVFRGRKSSMSNRLFEGFDREDMDPPRYDEAVFLRFGREADPLSGGYPDRAAELFKYDLVIWSDVEYDFFNQEQVKTTRDFVRKRGGALLLLGGPHGFAEADFGGTIVEGMLPVLLPRRGQANHDPIGNGFTDDWTVSPTLESEISGLLTLDPLPTVSQKLWEKLPKVSGLNRFAATRPGATVAARASKGGDVEPMYVLHRYGEGRTAVLATGTTWFWKLQLDASDSSHARIWKQILRDLAKDSPDPVRLFARQDTYPNEAIYNLEFQIRDEEFEPRETLQVEVEVTSPSGLSRTLPIDESLERPGLYTAAWHPEEEGAHGIRLIAKTIGGETIGEFEDRLQVNRDVREFAQARPRKDYLEQIAERSGGDLISLDAMMDLVEKLPWHPPDSRSALKLHLWHLPVFYLVLVSLLCCEWVFRRRKGFA